MTDEAFDSSVYDDPNCLLGGDEVDLKITKHKAQWHLDFAGDRYSIHVPSEGAINWALSKDPLRWHFEPNLLLTASSTEPNNWNRIDFIKVLSTWSPENDAHHLLVPIIRGHYIGWEHVSFANRLAH